MTLLAPLGLALGALIPVLILLYLLKVRRRDQEVSSTFLWSSLVRDLAAHEPWQRLRWQTLLALQIAVLALLTLGLARPALTVQAPEPVFAVVLLDASASMQAEDVAPNRFEAARRRAAELIAELPEGSEVTLVRVGAGPEVLASGERARRQVERALEQAQPSGAAGALREALLLAQALVHDRSNGRIVLVSDGSFPDPGPIEGGAPISIETVGSGGENQAITALTVRPDPRNPRRPFVFARVRNFSAAPVTRTLAIYADGALASSREAALPADGAAEYVFDDLPPGARTVEARLEGDDDLSLDDRAFLALDARPPTQVLVVTPGNLFLEKALSLLPAAEVYRVSPQRYLAIDVERYDVVVFDGYLPPQLPRGNLLLINPPDSPLLSVAGELRRPPITRWDRDAALLRYVDLRDVYLARAARLDAPGWARTVVESNGEPLVVAGETEGRKVVALAFDLRQSNLPLSAGFPILVANVMGYLEPSGALSARQVEPGEPVAIQPAPLAESVRVEDPAGETTTFRPEGQPVTFGGTERLGLYTVTQLVEESPVASESFAVNLTDEGESDLRARPLALPPAEDRPAKLVTTAREPGLWLLLVALGLVIGEWYWFHRR